MLNFNYLNKTEIYFGKDAENQVSDLILQHGKKVLLHYGTGSIKRNGVYDKIITNLKDNNIEYIELGGVVPNPRLSLVHEGVALCKKENIDFILAVGGGSVIDSAKAIAVGYFYDGDIWDAYTRVYTPEKALPIGVVLTIAAAGSESSTGSVITNQNGNYKKSYGSEFLRPKFAILNPEFTFTLPSYHSACGCVDIIAHVFERYFTNTNAVDLTSRMSEGLITTVMDHSHITINSPENYDSRAEVMWAGALAHNGLMGTGREADWASHVIAHELSALYDLAHGASLAIIFPAWMKHVYKTNMSIFLDFATNIMKIKKTTNEDQMVLDAIAKLESYYHKIGLPTTISSSNLPTDKLEHMANRVSENNTITIGNFKKLDKNDILSIYTLAK